MPALRPEAQAAELILLAAQAAAAPVAKVPQANREPSPPGPIAPVSQKKLNFCSRAMFGAALRIAHGIERSARKEGGDWEATLNAEAYAVYRMIAAGWGSRETFDKMLFDILETRHPGGFARAPKLAEVMRATMGRAWAGACLKPRHFIDEKTQDGELQP